MVENYGRSCPKWSVREDTQDFLLENMQKEHLGEICCKKEKNLQGKNINEQKILEQINSFLIGNIWIGTWTIITDGYDYGFCFGFRNLVFWDTRNF